MLRRVAALALLFALLALPSWAESSLAGVCRYCGRVHAEAIDEVDADTTGNRRKYAPSRVVDVQHIAIDVTPDFRARTIAATTKLTFAAIGSGVRKVELDAVRLRVSHIEATRELADTVIDDHQITLLFAEPLPVGEAVTVTIAYTAEPKQGLYFRTAAMGYPEGDTHIWTQGETHEARHWFPAFDYPNERSTTEVTCRVPRKMTVLSNGRKMDEVVDEAAGMKSVRWLQDKPHVSYLVCLVAGHLHELTDRHRDVPLGFYCQPSLAEHAANSFADTRQIMEFYEQEIGVPYPWDKYYQVTIRDFTSGGMENTTLTTLTHRTVFSDATENIRTSRDLDAHEMAHQWFGDLVTCEDWSHLWLNEGFATYYTHLYNGHKLGRDHLLYGLWSDAKDEVLPEAGDTKPIVYREYRSPWEQFDYRAYPKGSWVLHMLRSQLGAEVYRTAVRKYLDEHKFTSAVTEDLVDALENASGRELDRFFDQWVYHAGTPKLKLSYSWLAEERLARVIIEQKPRKNDNALPFELQTVLRFWVDGKTVDHSVLIREAKHEFFVPLASQPQIVRFDPEFTLLVDATFDLPQAMLESQLASSDDLIGRLLAIDALAKRRDGKSREAIAAALRGDAFYGVRVAAAGALGRLGSNEALELLLAAREQSDARVRLAVVEAIGKFYRPAARDALYRVVDDEANPAIVAAALRALGKFNERGATRRIVRALARESWGNEIALGAVAALGEQSAGAARERMLEVLEDRKREFADRDMGRTLKVLAQQWREADDRAPARSFLEECLADPSRAVRAGAVEALGELGDVQALALLRTFADQQDEARDASAARAAIAKLESSAPLAPRELSELRQKVGELEAEQQKLRDQLQAIEAKR